MEQRRPETEIDPGPGAALLHLFALSSFAIAQPLFEITGREGQFFLAHRAQLPDVILVVAALCWAPALAVWGTAGLAGSAGRAFRTAVLLAAVAGFSFLIALPILKRIPLLSGGFALAIAGVVGIAVAALYRKRTRMRLLLAFGSPAAVLFPLLFLASEPIREVVASGRTPATVALVEVENDTPVFLIVLDELPLSALLDERREIDPVRYPNFARLASRSTWYRNATTVAPRTLRSLSAIVTGRYPAADERVLPTAERFPENLFTLLGGAVRIRAREDVTRFCPPALAGPVDTEPKSAARRSSAMLGDLLVVYLHYLLPPAMTVDLPAVTGTWKGFQRTSIAGPIDPGGDRRRIFRSFVDSIASVPGPSLDYLHILLPHFPWEYLPSGRAYNAGWRISGWEHPEKGKWHWAENEGVTKLAYQRMLLQLGAVDVLLGEFLDRLEELGLMDPAMIVVTADHGMSFRAGEAKRGGAPEDLARDVMPVPLLVKIPGQTTGEINDRNAETVDILPTIADGLGVQIPWPVDGQSLLRSDLPERPSKTFRTEGGRDLLSLPAHSDAYRSTLEWKLAVFGSGATRTSGPFAFGPHRDLLGTRLADLPTIAGDRISAVLIEPGAFAEADPAADLVPAHIVGEIRGANRALSLGAVAIALNGVVQAVTEPYEVASGDTRFSAILPEEIFQPGANEIGILLIEDLPAGGRRLIRTVTGDATAIEGEAFANLTRTLLTLNQDRGFEGIRALNETRMHRGHGDKGLIVDAGRLAPQLELSVSGLEGHRRLLVRIDMESPADTNLRVFYQTREKPGFHPGRVVVAKLAEGRGHVVLRIEAEGLKGPWRLDPGTVRGRYILHSIEIRAEATNSSYRSPDWRRRAR